MIWNRAASVQLKKPMSHYRLEVESARPEKVVLRIGELDCLHNEGYSIRAANSFAISNYPMKLLLRRGSLMKYTYCASLEET